MRTLTLLCNAYLVLSYTNELNLRAGNASCSDGGDRQVQLAESLMLQGHFDQVHRGEKQNDVCH